MTEWEKLQTGQLYNDFDRGLFKRRIAAKRLFRAYNRTDDDEQTERRALMEQLFGSVGKNVWIEPDFRCEFGKNITIEDNAYINFGCVILDCAAGHSANTCSWRRTAGFTRPATRSTPCAASGGWSMLTQSPWAIMCGSAAACRSCPASRSGAMS